MGSNEMALLRRRSGRVSVRRASEKPGTMCATLTARLKASCHKGSHSATLLWACRKKEGGGGCSAAYQNNAVSVPGTMSPFAYCRGSRLIEFRRRADACERHASTTNRTSLMAFGECVTMTHKYEVPCKAMGKIPQIGLDDVHEQQMHASPQCIHF